VIDRLPRIRRRATAPPGKHDLTDLDAVTSDRRTAPDLVAGSLLDVVAALD
jgi:hypothetical protein